MSCKSGVLAVETLVGVFSLQPNNKPLREVSQEDLKTMASHLYTVQPRAERLAVAYSKTGGFVRALHDVSMEWGGNRKDLHDSTCIGSFDFCDIVVWRLEP